MSTVAPGTSSNGSRFAGALLDLLDRVGPARFAARLAHAGIELRFPRGATPNLTLILGGTGARLEDLVGAHAALHRNGLAGRVRYTPADPMVERRLFSPGAAWIVREILDSNPRPGEREGMFDAAGRPRVSWKTGTSYGFRDAWALGATRRYTVGVWVGRPDGTPLPGQYGAITALPLLFEVTDSLPRARGDAIRQPAPDSVRVQEICWPLGTAAEDQPGSLCRRRLEAWVLDGAIPPTFAERDARLWSAGRVRFQVDAGTGRRLSSQCARPHEARETEIARWPALLSPWLPAADRVASRLPPLAADCADDGRGALGELRIEGVQDGARLARPPGSTRAGCPSRTARWSSAISFQLEASALKLRAQHAGVEKVFAGVRRRLDELVADPQRYEPVFRKLLAQAVAAVGPAAVTAVEVAGKGAKRKATVSVEGGTVIEADKVLVAVGRKPNTAGLGLEEAGVELDERGRVAVDDGLATTAKGVYAIGDLIAGPMLAHKASEDGVALVESFAGGTVRLNHELVPGVVYTEPEIGTVGATEEQLKERGVPYKKGSFPFTANGRARALGHADGRVKILAHEQTDRILGVRVIGPRAGELVAEAVLSMTFGASSEDVARTIFAHPTLSEVVKEAALAVDGRALHM